MPRPFTGPGAFVAVPESAFTAPHAASVSRYETRQGPVPIAELVTQGAEWPALTIGRATISPIESKHANMIDWMTYYTCNLMNPKVLVGMLLGSMLAFLFCSMTMRAVGRAAGNMVEEVRRQFRENPGIMEGMVKPDYATCVGISTRGAQRDAEYC